MKNFFYLLLSLLCLISCSKNTEKEETDSLAGKHIEILYFYDNSDSPEFKAVKDGIDNILENEFKNEISEKIIELKEIDLSSTSGQEIAKNYNVKKPALFINNWIAEKEMKKNMTRFAYLNAASNPEIFQSEIKTLIEGYLSAKIDSTRRTAPSEKIYGGSGLTPPLASPDSEN